MIKSLTVFFSVIILYMGCSGSRISTTKEKESEAELISNKIRLLVDEKIFDKEILIEIPSYIYAEQKKSISVYPGNRLFFSAKNDSISLTVNNQNFEASYFQIYPKNDRQFLKYNGMKLRGCLKIVNDSNSVSVINTVNLESYLKGVVPREMPLGKGEEYFQALKAFAICARTYSLNKKNRNINSFDVYIDVRDQVYGGVDAETPISNRAVDETRGIILTYNKKPAVVFYHSTCGGRTEKVDNVFEFDSVEYLQGIVDGNPPYCSISPSFEWEEIYPEKLFVGRLRNAGLIDSQYIWIDRVEIINRFESGRVNELRIELLSSTGEKKIISIYGNDIRSILRTADNKSILKSNWFDIYVDEHKNVIITGKGYGHGVGLCQWGAINQSKLGYSFTEILSHYFPGTKISYMNDQI